MADKTTTAEDAASALDGSELIRIVQGGANKKATVTQVKTFGSADIQTNVNAAQALLASSGAAITAGQGYIIDNGGVTQLPTGISLMRVVGINLPAGAKGFDPNAEAYITALATYVPCTYDVGTNTLTLNEISKTVVIPSASVLTMGTIPVVLIPNISGFRVDVTSFVARNIVGSTPFDLTFDLSVAYSVLLAPPLYEMVNFFSADRTVKLESTANVGNALALLEEDIVAFETNGFDSSVGDGSVEIFLTYKYILIQ